MSAHVVVRDAAPADRNWILATWKKDAAAAEWAKRLRPNEYWAAMNYTCDRALDLLIVKVAALPEAPEIGVGWLVARPGEILYVYTKPRFREFGVDAKLCAAVPGARPRGWNPILELENLR